MTTRTPICEVSVESSWEAAHWLPGVPEGHKCRAVHGHSYRARITLVGPVHPETGMVVDFSDAKAALRRLTGALDHSTVNDTVPNPTVENLVVWMWNELAEGFDGSLREVRVWEGGLNTAAYRGVLA